jgi:hypothetical protein
MFDRLIAAYHHHGRIGRGFQYLWDKFDAAHIAQVNITKYDTELLRFAYFERFRRRARGRTLEVIGEKIQQYVTNKLFVIDYEYFWVAVKHQFMAEDVRYRVRRIPQGHFYAQTWIETGSRCGSSTACLSNKRATAQFCLKRNKYTQKMRLSVQNVLGMGHFGAVAV